MSNIPYVRQEEQQPAFIRSTEIPYAQQLGLQQLVIQATPPPPTYMVWSILNCLSCWSPLLIAVPIYSVKVKQTTPPSTYMVWPILICLCCCSLGIAAICYSKKVKRKAANNDQVGALEASQKARKINIAATVIDIIGIITTVVILIIYFVDLGKDVSDILEEENIQFN